MVTPASSRNHRKSPAKAIEPYLPKLGQVIQVILFLPVALPFALLFGWHVALIAMLIRRWCRIPYLVSMLLLYTGLTLPLWFLFETPGFLWIFYRNSGVMFPVMATVLVLLATAGPIAAAGREEIMEGSNVESAFPAHIMLCLMYLLHYMIDDAMKGNGG